MDNKKKLLFTFLLILPFLPCRMGAQAQRRMDIGELLEAVGRANKSVAASRIAAREADHQLEAAREATLPDIDVELTGSYNGDGAVWDRDFSSYHKAPIPHWGNSFALQARQTVYSGGAHTTAIRQAETARQIALNGSEATLQQQSFLAIGLFLDLCQIDNSIRVYRRNIELTERLIANVRAKHEQGTALRNDITRQELQLENQRLGLRRLIDRREVANSRLCAALSIERQLILPDTTVAIVPASTTVEAWTRRAADSSTLIRHDSLQVVMARHSLKAAQSRLLPKLSVVAEDHLTGPVTIDIPALNNNFNYWFVGVGLRYELSSLFKGRGDVRRSRAAIARSRATLDDTKSQVGEDVREAFTLFRQSESELSVRQKSVQLARENYQVISDRYLSDLAIVTDMTDAENLLLQSELDLENSRIAVAYAYYKLRYCSGTLLAE